MSAKTLIAGYRKTMRGIEERVALYLETIKAEEQSAKFFFRHRGTVGSTEVWGNGPTLQYDYCRTEFYRSKKRIKFYRRMVVSAMNNLQTYKGFIAQAKKHAV